MKSKLLLFPFLFFTLIINAQTAPGGFYEQWANYNNDDIGGLGQRDPNFDFSGLPSIERAPATGIHPRVFFGPNDITEIRNRMLNTMSGQAVMSQIHAYTTLLNLGYVSGGYNHNASYGKDASGNRYIDNAGKWDGNGLYTKLISEDANALDGYDTKRKHITASMMALEAFECMVMAGQNDPDTGENYNQRALDLAKAMAHWASLIVGDGNVNANTPNDFGTIHMAIAYDINFNNMTTAQQDLVRQGLAQIVPSTPRHGGAMAAYANTSNWSGLNSFEVITNLAIEGETGYNTQLTEQWARAYHTFINYGWYSSGAGYEGLGKNYMFLTTGIALAKRGYSILGHPNIKAYGTQFLPAIMQPFGHAFTSYDVWGGSGYNEKIGGYKFSASDVVGLKWLFPNDPKIDFLWRNYIEKSHSLSSTGYVYQQVSPDDSYYNYLLTAAIFAKDYDAASSWQSQANTNIEEDYFADDRGLAVMKSGTAADDIAVQFHCRQDMGGHTYADRNSFIMSALGRIWVRTTYGGSEFQPSKYQSMVLVNDKGVAISSLEGKKARQPGKVVEYNANSNASIVAGDATKAYSYEWDWSARPAGSDHPNLGSNGWEKVTETWNDYQYTPRSDAHFNLPFYDYASWHYANNFERIVRRPYNMMEKVFRTVALFKGDHPFVLVMDDIKKDNASQNYKWIAQIARDVTIESTNPSGRSSQAGDIILRETSGNRRLLVRVLQNEGASGTTPGYLDTLNYVSEINGATFSPNPNVVRPRLLVESNSIEPKFKIMLFPFMDGDPLPTTTWDADMDELIVSFPGELGRKIVFEDQHPDGRTRISEAALPVELLSFYGKKEKRHNQLYWETTSEINLDYFEIQRSAEGQRFFPIGKIKANNQEGLQNYEYTDISPLNGFNYYRLKQIDFDSSYTYSNIISIHRATKNWIKLFPNPSTGLLNIDNASLANRLDLYDINGQLIWSQILQDGQQQFDLSILPRAVYLYKAKQDDTMIDQGRLILLD